MFFGLCDKFNIILIINIIKNHTYYLFLLFLIVLYSLFYFLFQIKVMQAQINEFWVKSYFYYSMSLFRSIICIISQHNYARWFCCLKSYAFIRNWKILYIFSLLWYNDFSLLKTLSELIWFMKYTFVAHIHHYAWEICSSIDIHCWLGKWR